MLVAIVFITANISAEVITKGTKTVKVIQVEINDLDKYPDQVLEALKSDNNIIDWHIEGTSISVISNENYKSEQLKKLLEDNTKLNFEIGKSTTKKINVK